jgi:hypothetical protein
MALTSCGTPDQARARRSVKETEVDCNIRLNLPIRDILVEWASASFGDAFDSRGGC